MTEKRSDYRRRQAQHENTQEAADSAAFPASKRKETRRPQEPGLAESPAEYKTKILKRRLNFAILIVCLLIILVWVILLKF